MVVIAGSVRLRDGAQEAALAALAELIPATRAEDGCHTYTFAWDVDEPTVLRIYEEWESGDALEAHLATAHVRAFNEAIAPELVGRLELRGYEVVHGPFFED